MFLPFYENIMVRVKRSQYNFGGVDVAVCNILRPVRPLLL